MKCVAKLGAYTDKLIVGQTARREVNGLHPEGRMIRTVNLALEDMLGWSGAQVLNFRVDVRSAPANPLGYQEELRALLGPSSAAVIQKVRDSLCHVAGRTPTSVCRGIEGCLACLRSAAQSADGPASECGLPAASDHRPPSELVPIHSTSGGWDAGTQSD